MKKLSRLVASIIVAVIIVFSLPNASVSATSIESENPQNLFSSNIEAYSVPIYDDAGNLYSNRTFDSLASAQIYYGYDWTYSSCYVTYGGRSFNCCYAFSDGTMCFFNVR